GLCVLVGLLVCSCVNRSVQDGLKEPSVKNSRGLLRIFFHHGQVNRFRLLDGQWRQTHLTYRRIAGRSSFDSASNARLYRRTIPLTRFLPSGETAETTVAGWMSNPSLVGRSSTSTPLSSP